MGKKDLKEFLLLLRASSTSKAIVECWPEPYLRMRLEKNYSTSMLFLVEIIMPTFIAFIKTVILLD